VRAAAHRTISTNEVQLCAFDIVAEGGDDLRAAVDAQGQPGTSVGTPPRRHSTGDGKPSGSGHNEFGCVCHARQQ